MVLDPSKDYHLDGTSTTIAPVATGSVQGSDAFAGSTFGGDANVRGTDVAGILHDQDPRDFMYGRDPNYAVNTAAAERTTAAQTASKLNSQAYNAVASGQALGTSINNYGQTAAGTLGGMAQQVSSAGMAAAARGGAQANYQPANATFQAAKNDAGALQGLEAQQGPSAAQAQLQSGLNQAESSNLALARSGHGFGGSASALSQAAGMNAAAGQNATNASAQLSAQENAAWRARQASNLTGAAGITSNVGAAQQQQALSQAQLQQQTTAQNDQAQAALTGLGLTAQGKAGDQSISAATSDASTIMAGDTLGLQGTQAAMGAYGQGEQLAGANMGAQQIADLNREGGLIQKQGIQAGVAVNNANIANSMAGTALSTVGTIGGTAITAASDANAKTGVQSLDASTPPPPPASGAASTAPIAGAAGSAIGGAAGSAIAPGIGGVVGSSLGGLAGKEAAGADGPPQTVQQKNATQGGEIGSATGGIVGGVIGSALGPVGTVAGGALGSIGGGVLGKVIGSDMHIKADAAPLDSHIGAIGGAYGQSSAADNAGRSAAAGADHNSDLRAQAKQAAIGSMLSGVGKDLGSFGQQPTEDYLGQFEHLAGTGSTLPGATPQPYGMTGPVTSDEDEKTQIKQLAGGGNSGPPPAAPPDPRDRPLLKRPHPQWPIWTGPGKVTSDEEEKSGIHRSDASEMVDAAPGFSYFYKDPERHGQGQKFGPMAQDLLKTPAGASTVERSPDGTLAVNTGRLALVEHAALHSTRRETADRFARLEGEIEALKKRAS